MTRYPAPRLLLLSGAIAALVGCHSGGMSGSPIPDLSTILHQGMTDQEALRALGVTGPVVGMGGPTWNQRTLESPIYPRYEITLNERLGSDDQLHVTDWRVELARR